jgi:flagellar hook-basal body complex protein FliE
MNNLAIENLQKTIESGTGGVGSEFKASQSLKAEGLTPTDEQFGKNGMGFGDILKNSIEEVNKNQMESDRAMKELIAGRTKNIHETMLTIERADTSLKMAMQVRNKILEAYREVMRMQV